MDPYYCYLLRSTSHPNHTYIGITNNLNRRLDQHNGVLSGGAKATRKHKDWCAVKTVKLPDKSQALKFEYQAKHKKTRSGKTVRTPSGVLNKIKRMEELEQQFKFPPTVSSPSSVPKEGH